MHTLSLVGLKYQYCHEVCLLVKCETFKTRCNRHICSVKKTKKNSTTLKYIWKLKDNEIRFSIKREIDIKEWILFPNTNRCNLCVKEKHLINFSPHLAALNNRVNCRDKKIYVSELNKLQKLTLLLWTQGPHSLCKPILVFWGIFFNGLLPTYKMK